MKTTDPRILGFWTEFIDWSRREARTSVELRKILDKHGARKIFNAGVGDGFDAISLTKHGYDVESNEIDENFIRLAEENGGREGVDLFIMKNDWRDLPDSLNGRYDAVLCLGNSLTYLFDFEDRKKTVENFARLVKPGGIVVIDQRNYDYILDEREHILRDPRNNFRFSREFYYCGEDIDGFPAVIEDGLVVLNYARNGESVRTSLDVYPLRKQELTELMEGVGLDVTVYGDFEEGKERDVDFYQQVGVKSDLKGGRE